MNGKELFQLAAKHQAFTIQLRHRLHEIPELGWEEEKTLEVIKETISSIHSRSPLSFEVVEQKGGLWVDLTFDPNYERVLFRSDIDGLPINPHFSPASGKAWNICFPEYSK